MKIEGLWAGTETSYKTYCTAETGIDARIASGASAEEDDDERPYDVINGVGVISIKGPLTNRDSWMNEIFGITSYNSIQDAMIQAAEDPEVSGILLDVDSGGGAVAGVADTANLIRTIDRTVKPVTAFTGGSMYSAAYWLASAASTIYADKTAGVGSIGVIATHMSYAKQLENEGIEATVIRAGKYKSLASSVEPLSVEARAQIQKQLDSVYSVFVGHVAEMRGKSYEYADEVMANGREFIGASAQEVGLVDGIKSFDEVIATLNKSIDTSNKFMNNPTNSHLGDPMKRRALSEAVIAAIAEGAEIAADASEAAVAAITADAGEVVSAEVTEPAVEAFTELAVTAEADAGVVAFLQGQIKEKDADLLAANIQIADLNKQLSDVQASHEGLLTIAKKSVSNMRVYLNMPALDMCAISATSLLAEHASTSASFKANTPIGGVAAVDQTPTTAQAPLDAFAQRRQNAVRFSK